MKAERLQCGADRVAPEKPDILIGLPHNYFRSYLQEIVP